MASSVTGGTMSTTPDPANALATEATTRCSWRRWWCRRAPAHGAAAAPGVRPHRQPLAARARGRGSELRDLDLAAALDADEGRRVRDVVEAMRARCEALLAQLPS